MPWPELPEGAPRCVSVNSFGFGGTNAHTIIESYEPVKEVATVSSNPFAISLTFSAPNEKALATQLNTYLAYLAENKDINLNAVAWTLAKRSTFNYLVAFSAITADKLSEKIGAKLEAKKTSNTPSQWELAQSNMVKEFSVSSLDKVLNGLLWDAN